jgi:hypothetical protein
LLSLYLPPFLNSSVLSIFTFLFYLSICLSESSTLIFYLFSFFSPVSLNDRFFRSESCLDKKNLS